MGESAAPIVRLSEGGDASRHARGGWMVDTQRHNARKAYPAVISCTLVSGLIAVSACAPSTSSEIPAEASASSLSSKENTLTAAEREVRILIDNDLRQLRLIFDAPYRMRDVQSGNWLSETLAPDTIAISLQDGSVRIPAHAISHASAIEFVPETNGTIELQAPGETARPYPGRMRLLPGEDGGTVVNVADIEDYLVGVVTRELDQSFLSEACRAQAVAARTYAWYWKLRRTPADDWDLVDTERAQVYVGYARVEGVPEAVRAVRDTEGVVLTWNAPTGRRIFCTFYSSTCGGRTAPAAPVMKTPDITPLVGGVDCPYCEISKHRRWAPFFVTLREMTAALRDKYDVFRSMGPIERIEIEQQEEGGRLVMLRLHDAQNRSQLLEAENFRLTVDPGGRRIRSAWFTFDRVKDGYRFTGGRGFGHGVGLCQYGAQGMAQQGASAAQILQHYYPGSKPVRAY